MAADKGRLASRHESSGVFVSAHFNLVPKLSLGTRRFARASRSAAVQLGSPDLLHRELDRARGDVLSLGTGVRQRDGGDAGGGFIGDPHGTREEVVVSAVVEQLDALLEHLADPRRMRIDDVGLYRAEVLAANLVVAGKRPLAHAGRAE